VKESAQIGIVVPTGRKIGWCGLRSVKRAPPEREEFVKYKQITMDRIRSSKDVPSASASTVPGYGLVDPATAAGSVTRTQHQTATM